MAFQDTARLRQLWASRPLADLEGLGVTGPSGLRSLASNLGVRGKTKQDGKEVPILSAKKATLVQVIWDALESDRYALLGRQAAEELSALTVAEGAQALDQTTQTDLGTFAAEMVQELVTWGRAQWDVASQTWKLADRGLLDLSLKIVLNLEDRTGKTGEKLASTTIKRYKTFLKAMMEDLLEVGYRDCQEYPQLKKYLGDLMGAHGATGGYVSGLVDTGLKRHRLVKEQKQTENLKDRQKAENIREVLGLTGLYREARAVLRNAATGGSPRWTDVAIALMVVTGRRQVEVLVSGQFSDPQEAHGDSSVPWASFAGQAKTKGRGVLPAYDIPVLACPADIVAGLAYLGSQGKRLALDPTKDFQKALRDAGTLANRKYSSALGKDMGRWFDLVESTGGTKPLTGHKFRQLYAFVCRGLTGESGIQGIASILGDNDAGSVESYQADFRVPDAVVQEVLGDL